MNNVQVIAGRVADAAIPPGVLGVAVTQQTAARYSLHPGSRLKLGGPSGKLGIHNSPIDRAGAGPFGLHRAGASVQFHPDLAALGLPCGVILVLIAAALVAETSRSRRHGVTGLLRVQ